MHCSDKLRSLQLSLYVLRYLIICNPIWCVHPRLCAISCCDRAALQRAESRLVVASMPEVVNCDWEIFLFVLDYGVRLAAWKLLATAYQNLPFNSITSWKLQLGCILDIDKWTLVYCSIPKCDTARTQILLCIETCFISFSWYMHQGFFQERFSWLDDSPALYDFLMALAASLGSLNCRPSTYA